jgi:YbbR domain-containing protein
VRVPGFIRRNWRLKVGCFLIAFVTWVGVVYAGNPPETKLISVHVPQSPANIPSGFVLVHPVDDVLVRVGGDQNTLATLNQAVLNVTVSWSAATRAGTYPIPISITSTDPNIELIDPPGEVQVDLDAFKSVSVPVQIVITSPPPVGYQNVSEESTPSQVVIDGPAHELAGIQAKVTVDLSTQKANFQADLRVLAYDSKGNRLNNVGVDHTDVSVSIAISPDQSQRTVAVMPRIEGAPSPGHYLISITATPLAVQAFGPQDLLNSLVNFTTLPVFLTGVTGTYTVQVGIVGQAGITLSVNKVTVTIVMGTLAPPPTPTPSPSPSPTGT